MAKRKTERMELVKDLGRRRTRTTKKFPKMSFVSFKNGNITTSDVPIYDLSTPCPPVGSVFSCPKSHGDPGMSVLRSLCVLSVWALSPLPQNTRL